MWVNTVNPWSIRWIKMVVDGPDTGHALKHLQSFVHDSCLAEVNSSLLADLHVLSPNDAHWILCNLQHCPHFVCHTSSSSTSLEVPASIITNDAHDFQVTALIDLGCTSSSIDCTFVLKKELNTHKLP